MKNRVHIGIGMTAGLLALAVVSLSGCGKQEPVEAPQALRFCANVQPETRTYISGTSLVDASASSARLPIFAAGTFHGMNGVVSELFTESSFKGQKFVYSTADAMYHADPDPVYWPMGGYTDFLAYAGPSADAPASNPAVSWPGAHYAEKASFAFTDTKAADIDLVWAVANDRQNMAAPVDLTFSHALARLELEVRVLELADNRLTLKSMVLQTGDTDKLQLAGTFTVDNTLVVPAASWSALSVTSDYGFFTGQQVTFASTGATSLTGLLDGTARVAKSGTSPSDPFVPFASMFIPEQPSKNLVITYSLDGGTDIVKTVNLPLMTWEMGHAYRYRLEFVGDISLEVTITAWGSGNTLNMELQ